jgi:light-regulated signal transduction histidine kinase (bacteriophytochrome)
MNSVLAIGEPVTNRELLHERPDAPPIHLLVNIAPLRDSAGQMTGTVTICQDISELKRSQRERERLLEELERSNKDLSQFTYAVSHDLKAPVHSVRALTQLLVRRNDGPSEDAAHLATLIEQAARGMECLIDSLLRYAQAGQGELIRQRVSAQTAVDAVRVSLGALVAKTGAHISTTDLPDVDADPVQLQQLFQNLIANAIKYQRKGEAPAIEVRGETVPNGWRFAVKDNGQGIRREHHSLIFEPLKRLHGNDTPGSGLGLALCKTIVERHGGRIWVESEGTGHGSTFVFTLPSARNES